jgi:uncharacterized protein
MMTTAELLKSVLAGIAAGVASGFLGVSPGGILVPVISLLLPFSQHVIQGISLIVQAPPTGLSGLSIYLKGGRSVALRPVVLVSLGFVLGGPGGAVLARMCTDRELKWMFVGYLSLLAVLATGRKSTVKEPARRSPRFALPAIGFIAGVTSGLLGIGGGLAITTLTVVLLHKEQHEAQALSLAITILPLTLPAAWVYIRAGWDLPWEVILCLLGGLVVGTRAGALFANRLSERKLKICFATLLIGLAIYMGATAIN